MSRLLILALSVGAVCVSGSLSAQGQLRQQGRAVIEYRSPELNMVAAYEYSHRNHGGAWLLIELAVQSAERIAFHRDDLSLIAPKESAVIPVATQQQFLEDHEELTQLLQNAQIWRRSLDSYFLTRPQPTIRFFARPGEIVHDSAISNRDEVAAGELFFKSPTGKWPSGTYTLVLSHEEAKGQLPITLQ